MTERWANDARVQFSLPIVSLDSIGDVLRVTTEDGAVYFIGPRDWTHGVGSALTWRARLRLRMEGWLARWVTRR